MIGTCRLCNKEGALRKSHIIPEFIYKPLYDNKHRYYLLTSSPSKGPAKLQKGVREYLLCEGCEITLSKYERYISLLLSGKIKILHRREGKRVYLEGIDYKKMRIFGLSVLWRAGVSSLRMFEQVQLGRHEETIRTMILNEDPGEPTTYPFMLALVVHEEKVQTDLIMQPTRTRADGHLGYRFVFGGLAWIFIVSSHKPPQIISQASISKEGKLVMLISSIENMPFIINFFRELVGSGNLPPG